MSLLLGTKFHSTLRRFCIQDRRALIRESSTSGKSASLDAGSFSDHRTAYGHLSTGEVLRAWIVLKICSLEYFVQNSIKILEHSERALGRNVLEKILRPTLYRHFVAGDDPQSLMVTAAKLKSVGIRLMVLPSMEEDVGQGETQQLKYDSNTRLTVQLADITAEHGGPLSCLQTKITALISANLLLKIAERNPENETQLKTVSQWANYLAGGTFAPIPFLSSLENLDLEKGLERLKTVGQTAVDKQLRLLVDGEYTYLNNAISIAALAMAGAFNNHQPVVWNTYQCYLRDAFVKVKRELQMTKDLGVCFGAKVVRGAYLERERQLADSGNYEDPTNPTYEATSGMYNRVVDYLLTEVRRVNGACNVIVATHNEASVLNAISRMRQQDILPSDNTVVFGQIFGMASNITVKLASEGYVVYNSVPYGSLFDVLPYLSRRATENRAVLKGTRRERTLLSQELRARMLRY